ncbi:MAG: DNA-binding protein WhiA [Clostridia bacterium]|nr:DNA-binding protein WhiA [Clostridia bacterium]
MSFSSNVKEELSKISTLNNKQSVKAELIGYLITNNVNIDERNIKFSTENEYNINRFSKLLSNLGIVNHEIDIQGKIYTVSFRKTYLLEKIEFKNKEIILEDNINKQLEDEICRKSLVRGSFLGGGSINNPENKYHLEVIFSSQENAIYIANILNSYEIECKILNKSHCYSLYSKEGETISNLLAFIGASSSVLKFEEIRVVRDMRNNVNRLVNCETANLNKIINASLKQIDDIKLIKEQNEFKNLSKNLQEIADVRLKNPEASLIELGNMLEVPVREIWC